MLKQKQMILIMLFVHFECYAYTEREEKFLYKLVGQHKCISPFLVLIRIALGLLLGFDESHSSVLCLKI